MSQDVTLWGKQPVFVELLLGGATVESASKQCGITRRTGYRWLAMPAIRARLTQAQDVALEALALRLGVAMGAAISTLLGVMGKTEATDAVRVQAAGKALDAGLRYRDAVTLAERITALEQNAKQ